MAETEQERTDRELIELLNELRVALPGVQVLFAFLLTVPFTARYEALTELDRRVYFAAVLSSAIACALLIAPSAHHRVRFRDAAKAAMVRVANVLAILGFIALAAGIACSLFLVADVLFANRTAAYVSGGFAAFTVVLWFVVPLLLPSQRREDRRQERRSQAGGAAASGIRG